NHKHNQKVMPRQKNKLAFKKVHAVEFSRTKHTPTPPTQQTMSASLGVVVLFQMITRVRTRLNILLFRAGACRSSALISMSLLRDSR
ncbi:hypothetical protein, partial [Gulosibacter hominis]|uniref:hypothetical protein n=1 Tax=Gulosibacter hominis TaxID=2770504 RepID=UPI001E4E9019